MFEVGFRTSRLSEVSVEGLAPVYSSPSLSSLYNRFFKRVLDVFLVLLAAPFVLPLVLLMGLMIRRDGGSAFYTQDRIGLNGETFRIYKLRTMVTDADAKLAAHLAADPEMRAEWEETQKLKNDPR
ncbi:sugar transferase, partial [Amaricoccus sp. HAR-UPW-R2A-40]